MTYFGITLYDPVHACNMGAVARLCVNYEASFLNIINKKDLIHGRTFGNQERCV